MYNNPGRKIKDLAFWFCVIGITIDFILAIMAFGLVMNMTSSYYSNGEIGISLIVAVFVFGILCVLSWLSFLLLAAFGELVENSTKLVQIFDGGAHEIKKNDETIKEDNNPAVCPNCGEKVEPDARFCEKCGQHIV